MMLRDLYRLHLKILKQKKNYRKIHKRREARIKVSVFVQNVDMNIPIYLVLAPIDLPFYWTDTGPR